MHNITHFTLTAFFGMIVLAFGKEETGLQRWGKSNPASSRDHS